MRVGELNFNGNGAKFLTFLIATGTLVGDAVTNTASGEKGRGAANLPVTGKLAHIGPQSAGSVQIRGVATFEYSGTAPTPGMVQLQTDGAGKVKVGASGPYLEVLAVEPATSSVAVLLK